MLCVCAHHSASGTSRGSAGRTASSFFLNKKECFALTEAVQFQPFFPAETLKACALIGLHLMAAEGESFFSSSCCVFSLELGGIPGLSGPRYPLWQADVSCCGNESTVNYEVYEQQ